MMIFFFLYITPPSLFFTCDLLPAGIVPSQINKRRLIDWKKENDSNSLVYFYRSYSEIRWRVKEALAGRLTYDGGGKIDSALRANFDVINLVPPGPFYPTNTKSSKKPTSSRVRRSAGHSGNTTSTINQTVFIPDEWPRSSRSEKRERRKRRPCLQIVRRGKKKRKPKKGGRYSVYRSVIIQCIYLYISIVGCASTFFRPVFAI